MAKKAGVEPKSHTNPMQNEKIFSAKVLIDRRRELWMDKNDIEEDAQYRLRVTSYLQRNPEARKALVKEMHDKPELMIELFFVIVDKEERTVPFFLNDVQVELKDILNKALKDFMNGKRNHLKFLLLKGRQQGFTQFITAYQLACCLTRRNFSGYTLADTTENTETIFTDKAKFPLDNLPDFIKPTQKYNNRRELHFQKPDASGLNSKMRVSTSGDRNAGRSKTLNFFHGSECAFWKDLNGTLRSLGQALTQSCMSILESTAFGFNAYKMLWDDDNNWTKLFFAWWKTSEYRMTFESPAIEKAFIKAISEAELSDKADTQEWALWRIKWLLHNKTIDMAQAYWYFNKWKDLRSDIRQEYPCTPEEAFLSTGQNFFVVEELIKRMTELMSVSHILAQGYFEYDYTTDKRTKNKLIDTETITWVDNQQGEIKIFLEPEPKIAFVIGADTATDGTDNNIAQVVDRTGRQHATVKICKDEDVFAEQMYCLGWYYNNAMIVPEVNHSTHPTKVLVERGYPNVYVRGQAESPTDMSANVQAKYGFRTDMSNRPSMLGLLRQLVRDHTDYINDIDTVKEMLTFVRDDTGKPTAEVGEHDDRVMSYAIAIQTASLLPEQIKLPLKKLEGYYTDSELEDLGYSRHQIKEYMSGRMELDWRE